MQASRANAIPETALVMSLSMTMLFGVVQTALVGFNQVSADGAAFVGDRATVAQYSAPSSANAAYAQQVAQGIFTGASGKFTGASNASNTYELDYTGSQATLSTFGGLFPSALNYQSRIIEASTNTPPPALTAGGCPLAQMQLTVPGAPLVAPAVGLIQNTLNPNNPDNPFLTPLYGTVSTTTGRVGVALTSTGLAATVGAHVGQAENVAKSLNAIATTLQALSTVVNSPVVSATLGLVGQSSATISAAISPLLNEALVGSATSGDPTGSEFDSQVSGLSSTISRIVGPLTSLIGANPLLGPLLGNLNSALFGSGSAAGLLSGPGTSPISGGPNNLLSVLNWLMNQYVLIDQNATAGCPNPIPKLPPWGP